MKTTPLRPIQTRLFVLLFRAFAAAVLLTLLIVLTVTALVLSSSQSALIDHLPMMTRLETFYYVNRSWQGIEVILPLLPSAEDSIWARSILLDENGLVILQQGSATGSGVGLPYQPSPLDSVVPIRVGGAQVGTLIFAETYVPLQGRFVLGLLTPVFFISIFLAILTTLIGLLLIRRFVTPLAQVIAAAQAVAAGDLTTRVPVSGPDDLRSLLDSFNYMAETLQRNDQERRNLLAEIAHELRPPLTVMRGRLEGIVDGIYPPDQAHILPALEETFLLERLVEDLRLLTLAETRQLPLERRPTDLNLLAGHVVGLFRAQAQEKGIALSLETAPAAAMPLLDGQRTEQVIQNLVGNALRYTPEGGNVWVTVRQAQGRVWLSVQDNGAGVSDADLPHLFDRFWRAEKSRSRALGGAGLGLAIARQLIEAQDGKITARNRQGGGLCVEFWFETA